MARPRTQMHAAAALIVSVVSPLLVAQDLDDLIEDHTLLGAFALHTPERTALAAAWLGVRLWGGRRP